MRAAEAILGLAALVATAPGCVNLQPPREFPRDAALDADVAALDADVATLDADVLRVDAADADDAPDGRDALAADVPDATDTPPIDVPDAADAPGADGPEVTPLDVRDALASDADAASLDATDAPPTDARDVTSPDLADAPGSDVRDVPPSGLGAQRSCPVAAERGCGLVEIARGTFTLGGDPMANRPGRGQTITVGRFALDAYEVTVARFRRFWTARAADFATTRRLPIAYPNGTTIAWNTTTATDGEPDTSSVNGECTWTRTAGALEAHPINCLNWWVAQEFCVWDGGRLPTEAEWEYAARGRAVDALTPGRAYPFGDTAPTSMCDVAVWNNGRCMHEDGVASRRVGSFRASGGVFDLAGNMSEWVADAYSPYESTACWMDTQPMNPLCYTSAAADRVLRGGSWDASSDVYLRGASRFAQAPNNSSNDFGLRCARTLP